jgi:hypothetical protein
MLASDDAGAGPVLRLPVTVVVAAALAMKTAVACLVRDQLTSNMIMLLYPVDSTCAWQAGA